MQAKSKSKAKKCQRREKWLQEDRDILKELLKEVDIIENKNTNNITKAQKAEAWEDLKNRFNCMCKGVQRTVTQLKSQWGDIKTKSKRKEHRKTDDSDQPLAVDTSIKIENIKGEVTNAFTIDLKEFNSDLTQMQHEDINQNTTYLSAEQVAASEIECVMELPRVQLLNEQKKCENLTLENILIKTKIEYYKKKIQNINLLNLQE